MCSALLLYVLEVYAMYSCECYGLRAVITRTDRVLIIVNCEICEQFLAAATSWMVVPPRHGELRVILGSIHSFNFKFSYSAKLHAQVRQTYTIPFLYTQASTGPG